MHSINAQIQRDYDLGLVSSGWSCFYRSSANSPAIFSKELEYVQMVLTIPPVEVGKAECLCKLGVYANLGKNNLTPSMSCLDIDITLRRNC